MVSGMAFDCVGLVEVEGADDVDVEDVEPDVELGADPWKSTIDSLLICVLPLLMSSAFELTV